MIYVISSLPEGKCIGVFSSLEAIDTSLEKTSFVGRGLYRQAFTVYREQGPGMGVAVANISPRSMDTWAVPLNGSNHV